ncbi:MAG: hypothetical protein M5U09_14580 [Gammaproteobacteria bacterium]|nr:hypothetical protein [Gammaproteobacteria bacterium]
MLIARPRGLEAATQPIEVTRVQARPDGIRRQFHGTVERGSCARLVSRAHQRQAERVEHGRVGARQVGGARPVRHGLVVSAGILQHLPETGVGKRVVGSSRYRPARQLQRLYETAPAVEHEGGQVERVGVLGVLVENAAIASHRRIEVAVAVQPPCAGKQRGDARVVVRFRDGHRFRRGAQPLMIVFKWQSDGLPLHVTPFAGESRMNQDTGAAIVVLLHRIGAPHGRVRGGPASIAEPHDIVVNLPRIDGRDRGTAAAARRGGAHTTERAGYGIGQPRHGRRGHVAAFRARTPRPLALLALPPQQVR